MDVSDEDLRACGFTPAARNYPLSDRAVRALAFINGLPYEAYAAVRGTGFAPNAYCQQETELRGELHERGELKRDADGRLPSLHKMRALQPA